MEHVNQHLQQIQRDRRRFSTLPSLNVFCTFSQLLWDFLGKKTYQHFPVCGPEKKWFCGDLAVLLTNLSFVTRGWDDCGCTCELQGQCVPLKIDQYINISNLHYVAWKLLRAQSFQWKALAIRHGKVLKRWIQSSAIMLESTTSALVFYGHNKGGLKPTAHKYKWALQRAKLYCIETEFIHIYIYVCIIAHLWCYNAYS